MITRYVAETRVVRIEQRFEKRVRSGVGEKADVSKTSTGWWIVTESPEPYAVRTGAEKPEHAVGDEIRLIVEIRSKRSKS